MTATELIENFFEEQYRDSLLDGSIVDYQEDIRTLMIQFAKLHVLEALKSASKKAILGKQGAFGVYWNRGDLLLDEESVINSYPLTEIK